MNKPKLVILSGAGISAESGLKTFRDGDGLWEDHRVEDVATPEAFARDPQLVLNFYNYRRQACAAAQPNDAHKQLVTLEQDFEVTIITQNIDGLHQRSGVDRSIVYELHGTNAEVSCLSCGDRVPMDEALERVKAGEAAPRCLHCGGLLKPATISFGQALVPEPTVWSR